jgi:hypothetical protein
MKVAKQAPSHVEDVDHNTESYDECIEKSFDDERCIN